ncbi:MAG: SPFH domain-containing protein [Prevotella sp.]|jgi:regulator of protease activity HflC (stomatin/prohibitin superfamily)|nr:SPFH domain-containing protein [Prevotella sp.]MBQ9532822.1 SPFH domain-containing protein [Prevotella sp.]
METKEFKFKGMLVNGFLMLFVTLFLFALVGFAVYKAIDIENGWYGALAFLILVVASIMSAGFVMIEPGMARVMMFFGQYRGTFAEVGYHWVNPFITTKKLSMRARNLDAEPIKVNDKVGNPVMIGMVLVWKLKDTYKAMFEIDSQTMAQVVGNGQATVGTDVASVMRAFERFVKIQSDAALRQVAGQYAYDDTENDHDELTLRSGGEEINQELEAKLNERLDMAGIEVVEARINYLAYAPEIAAVMLRRQQAAAIITAREKIVEGAVSMVKMALDKLSAEKIVELDDEKKAAMVSNLLVVLCGDDSAQPVVNTGSLKE